MRVEVVYSGVVHIGSVHTGAVHTGAVLSGAVHTGAVLSGAVHIAAVHGGTQPYDGSGGEADKPWNAAQETDLCVGNVTLLMGTWGMITKGRGHSCLCGAITQLHLLLPCLNPCKPLASSTSQYPLPPHTLLHSSAVPPHNRRAGRPSSRCCSSCRAPCSSRTRTYASCRQPLPLSGTARYRCQAAAPRAQTSTATQQLCNSAPTRCVSEPAAPSAATARGAGAGAWLGKLKGALRVGVTVAAAMG